MPTSLDSLIESIVSRSAAVMAEEIAQVVRQSIAAQIAGTGLVARGRSRKDARDRGAVPKDGRARRRIRRSDKQVAADDAKILNYIKAHPAARSIAIQKEVRLSKPAIASGLLRLREAHKIKSKGVRAGTTYSVSSV
jgi:hypothetical protein